MQVVINVDNAFGPNPDYNPDLTLDPDHNWPERHVPRGTIITHPQSYMLCQGSDPRAEPHDDEAKAVHAKYLAAREAGLAARAAAKSDAPAEPDDGDEVVSEKPTVRRRLKRDADLTES